MSLPPPLRAGSSISSTLSGLLIAVLTLVLLSDTAIAQETVGNIEGTIRNS